jgi:hypothetical protein
MALVLQVFGVIFLLLVVLLIVVVLTIRAKIRGFVRNLEGIAKTLAAGNTPARVHLRPMAVPSWENLEAVEAQVEPLSALGFVQGGSYQVDEMEGLAIQAWFNAERGVTAVVYEHPVAGVWTDMVTRYQDGTIATFANTGQGSGVDHAPGHVVERFPGIGSAELFERFLADRPDRPWVTPSPDAFVDAFEKAYADEMDWRNSRGGATEDEIRRIAQLSGETYDEEVVQATRRMAEARAAVQLDEAIRERFLAEATMSAAEWEAVRDRVVVVHDRMTQDTFAEAITQSFDGEYDWDADGLPQIDRDDPGKSPRRLFAEINAGFGDGRRCRKLGVVHQPVEADVYVAPETE